MNDRYHLSRWKNKIILKIVLSSLEGRSKIIHLNRFESKLVVQNVNCWD